MTDRYDQPFYIPVGHRLRERWGSQLSPIAPDYFTDAGCHYRDTEPEQRRDDRPISMSEKDKAGHRRGELLYLLGKVKELDIKVAALEEKVVDRHKRRDVY